MILYDLILIFLFFEKAELDSPKFNELLDTLTGDVENYSVQHFYYLNK